MFYPTNKKATNNHKPRTFANFSSSSSLFFLSFYYSISISFSNFLLLCFAVKIWQQQNSVRSFALLLACLLAAAAFVALCFIRCCSINISSFVRSPRSACCCCCFCGILHHKNNNNNNTIPSPWKENGREREREFGTKAPGFVHTY